MEPIPLPEFLVAERSAGIDVWPAAAGTYWTRQERWSIERRPIQCFDVPSKEELRQVLRASRAAVATYVREAQEQHPANAALYICRDQDYCLAKLAPAVRRAVRRAYASLRFEFVDAGTLRARGLAAYCDTRARVGLSDGTPAAFVEHCNSLFLTPARVVVAAWFGDALAAYLALTMLGDWTYLHSYSANQYLHLRPNNGLMHFVLDYCLAQRRVRAVTFGLSSIQESGNRDSLHVFKRKVGFECLPVRREFVFHPLLRPMANRLTLLLLRGGVRLWPRQPTLRKAAGMLATHLGKRQAEAIEQLAAESPAEAGSAEGTEPR